MQIKNRSTCTTRIYLLYLISIFLSDFLYKNNNFLKEASCALFHLVDFYIDAKK